MSVENYSKGPTFTPKDQLVVPKDLKKSCETETDVYRIETRLKQIQFGKNTVGYDNYLAAVPKEKRLLRPEHPTTPDIYEKISKRHFDGRVKAWRRSLHLWDNMDERPDSKPRQKRKAETLDEGDSCTKVHSQQDEGRNKRLKTASVKSPEPNLINADEKCAENTSEFRPFAIGEEEDDGYCSDDVL